MNVFLRDLLFILHLEKVVFALAIMVQFLTQINVKDGNVKEYMKEQHVGSLLAKDLQ